MRDARFASVVIDAPPETVAQYLRDASRLPDWAPNFGHEIRPDGDNWVMATKTGDFKVRMAPDNPFGVADHWVVPPGSTAVLHNAIRVTENDDASLVVFVVLRQDGFDDSQFDEDEAMVQSDLRRLKGILDGKA